MIWRDALALLAGLLVAWAALVIVLWRMRPAGAEPGYLRQSLRLLPDVVRLLRRLASDRQVPRRVRVRIWLLLAYLAFPIDLVPDFIPVIGYADDVILVVAVLRSVLRRAGEDTLAARWPGTPDGLAALLVLVRSRTEGSSGIS